MDDDREQELRIDLMTIQIERLRQEIKMENRKFAVQLAIAIAAALGVGIAIGRFWLFHL
jgi:DNA-binding transcriptional regulator YiaG